MATYGIYPMTVAQCGSPEPRLLYLGDPKKEIPTDFMFWLLKGEKRAVLVDTGFTAEFCSRFMPDLRQQPDQDPIKQLAKHGVKPEDVEVVVLTHAHFDHLSDTASRYRNAKFYLQKTELDFVTNPPHPWFREFVDHDTLQALAKAGAPRFNLLDGDGEIVEGISTITTPGHTQGHQSVLVETKKGKACILGDAAFTYLNLEKKAAPGFNSSLIDALKSLDRLLKLQEEGVVLLPGHEPQVYKRFKGMPIL